MKIIIWVIVIVAIVVFIYIFLNLSASRIGFNFSLNKVDFSSFNLEDFVNNNAFIKIDVNTLVTNLNPFNINFSFLEVWICHNNILIAKSSKVLEGKIGISSNSITNFVLPLDLYINSESIKVASLLKLKQPVEIQYTVKLNLFGISIPKYSDKYISNG